MKDEPYTQALQEMGVEVLYGPHYAGRFNRWWSENGRYFDCAFLSRAHVALNYLEIVRQHAPECEVLYYGHDIPWQRVQQEYSVTGLVEKREEALRLKEIEDTICSLVDVIIYPNSDECNYAREHFPNARDVLLMPLFTYEESAISAAEAGKGWTQEPNHLRQYQQDCVSHVRRDGRL